jgi:hypothetical protein
MPQESRTDVGGAPRALRAPRRARCAVLDGRQETPRVEAVPSGHLRRVPQPAQQTTKASEAISEYIRRNGSKVLLLTATPYNLAFADVANQVGLYIEDDEDLGIQPSAAMAKDPTLADKVDGKITTLAAFRRSEEPEDWKRLMSDHLVRRTRSFIKRTAKKETTTLPDGTTEEREFLQFANGQRFHFPTRIAKPLSHDFSDDDPARLMENDETLDAIRDLTLPRYRLADYDDPRAEHSGKDSKILADIRSGRGNVSGFVRMGLFKRLSSSGQPRRVRRPQTCRGGSVPAWRCTAAARH